MLARAQKRSRNEYAYDIIMSTGKTHFARPDEKNNNRLTVDGGGGGVVEKSRNPTRTTPTDDFKHLSIQQWERWRRINGAELSLSSSRAYIVPRIRVHVHNIIYCASCDCLVFCRPTHESVCYAYGRGNIILCPLVVCLFFNISYCGRNPPSEFSFTRR